ARHRARSEVGRRSRDLLGPRRRRRRGAGEFPPRRARQARRRLEGTACAQSAADPGLDLGLRPYRIPLAISDVGAGLYLTIGVLSALQARHKTGEGQWVETSLLEATVSLGVYEAANYFATGVRPEKLGQGHRGSSPYQVFQTKDGWITIGAAQQNFFAKVCAMIGKPELVDDPRFKANALRVKNNAEIVAILQAELSKKTNAEWLSAFEAE